ncbi:nucleotidyltransferase family protein [Microbacterium elymi]|uniref:Nucleotidyltransferase domain-containing protein n=1 Tax=Microbacterium elymi TaxID=2909587 RepID=A0ABY5NN57_9MICO|nr:nucleotidyltransferase domain-containing protein [Microbacterium elymi]UUT36519.1 nucleotidyltransferase domain-containing protein [Microbacterium elymi]
MVADAGGSRVRVFGSVATEEEHAASDVDLLFSMGKPLSLMQLERLEGSLAELLGVSVDLVPESALRPDIRDRIMSEAVAL